MVNQNAGLTLVVGAGLALIVAGLGEPATAQTSNTNCYRIGNAVNCQTMTAGRPSAGSNVDWNALNQAANTIGSIPQAAQQGASAGYQLGQMAAIRSALRGVDINNPDSVSRAVGALVRAGAFDQARQLMVLHNSLMARNAEAASPPAPPSQMAESQPSAGVPLVGAPATGPEGLWNTPVHHGVVEVYDCGEALCARIVTSDALKRNPTEKDINNKDPALHDQPLRGLTVMSDFKGGPTEWKDGRVYNPADGGAYRGSIELVDPDTIRLTGCIIISLCQTQTWTRIH